MRTLIATICCLALLAGTALAADPTAGAIPNLVGKYSGKHEMHFKDKGFKAAEGVMVLEILEQRGHVLHGKKTWNNGAAKGEETFSGVISADGKYLYIAEHEDGLLEGDIVDGGKGLTLYYLESGKSPKAFFYDLKKLP